MTDDLIFIMKLYAYTQIDHEKYLLHQKRQPTKVTVFNRMG